MGNTWKFEWLNNFRQNRKNQRKERKFQIEKEKRKNWWNLDISLADASLDVRSSCVDRAVVSCFLEHIFCCYSKVASFFQWLDYGVFFSIFANKNLLSKQKTSAFQSVDNLALSIFISTHLNGECGHWECRRCYTATFCVPVRGWLKHDWNGTWVAATVPSSISSSFNATVFIDTLAKLIMIFINIIIGCTYHSTIARTCRHDTRWEIPSRNDNGLATSDR